MLCLASLNEGEVCGPRFLGSVGISTALSRASLTQYPYPASSCLMAHRPLGNLLKSISSDSGAWRWGLRFAFLSNSWQHWCMDPETSLEWLGQRLTNRGSCLRKSSVSLSILHPLHWFIWCKLESAYSAQDLWKQSFKTCGNREAGRQV